MYSVLLKFNCSKMLCVYNHSYYGISAYMMYIVPAVKVKDYWCGFSSERFEGISRRPNIQQQVVLAMGNPEFREGGGDAQVTVNTKMQCMCVLLFACDIFPSL